MKIAKLFIDESSYYESLVHDLYVLDSIISGQPIDLLTMLMAHEEPGEEMRRSSRKWQCGYAIQVKREAVTHFHQMLTDGSSQVKLCDKTCYVRSYAPLSRLLAFVEAYLGSIYSTLETMAEYNHVLNNNLPPGFRKQIPLVPDFSTTSNDWLASLLDLRSEITHHSAPIVDIHGEDLLVTFSRAKRNMFYPQDGKTLSISIEELATYQSKLEALLDRWARTELSKVDPSRRIQVFVRDRDGQPRQESLELSFLLEIVGCARPE